MSLSIQHILWKAWTRVRFCLVVWCIVTTSLFLILCLFQFLLHAYVRDSCFSSRTISRRVFRVDALTFFPLSFTGLLWCPFSSLFQVTHCLYHQSTLAQRRSLTCSLFSNVCPILFQCVFQFRPPSRERRWPHGVLTSLGSRPRLSRAALTSWRTSSTSTETFWCLPVSTNLYLSRSS